MFWVIRIGPPHGRQRRGGPLVAARKALAGLLRRTVSTVGAGCAETVPKSRWFGVVAASVDLPHLHIETSYAMLTHRSAV